MAEKTTGGWGQVACPLVPAALRRSAAQTAAPAPLCDAFGRALTLGDLDAAVWSGASKDLDKAGLAELVKSLTPLLHAHAATRIAEDDATSTIDSTALALPPQTAKFLGAATAGRPLAADITFGDLLAMPQIGPRRAIEIACALEAYLDAHRAAAPDAAIARNGLDHAESLAREVEVTTDAGEPTSAATSAQAPTESVEPAPTASPEPASPEPPADASSRPAPARDAPVIRAAPPGESLIGTVVMPPGERRERDRRQVGSTPREIKTFFRVLAAWASGERGEQTLKNALPAPKPGWPPELVQLWKRVRYCSAAELAGTLRDRYAVADLVQQAFAGCDQRHRLILQARVLTTTKPTSLDALAAALMISVDDVRALQRAALGYLERLQTKPFRPVTGRARLIRERLGCAVPERDSVLKQALDWVVSDFKDFPDLDFARELMLWLAGPYRLKEHWYVTSADLPMRTVQALLEHRNRDGVIETSNVRKVLSGLAIHPKYHEAWIDRVGEFIGVGNGLMSSQDRVAGPLPAVPPR